MTSRLLPRDEWPALAGTELEAVWPVLPDGANVVVVEDDGRIVGCWAVFPLVHVEGLWISPEFRGGSAVGRRLIAGMVHVARDMGAEAVVTAAISEDVVRMLEKAGAAELPGRHFSWRIVGVDAKNTRK